MKRFHRYVDSLPPVRYWQFLAEVFASVALGLAVLHIWNDSVDAFGRVSWLLALMCLIKSLAAQRGDPR